VLVTGTHDASREIVNTLYNKGGVVRTDTLGAAARAVRRRRRDARRRDRGHARERPRARGRGREAQDYAWNALRKGYRPGMGRFLPDRLFWARDESEARGEEEAEAAPRRRA
jgi:hydroxymethylpyrimidine/phosphomethylpyrimidine kinase